MKWAPRGAGEWCPPIMNTMRSRLTEPDHQLVWSRALFVEEASKLLNRKERKDWTERCQLLLEDAFVRGYSDGPAVAFKTVGEEANTLSGGFGDPWSSPRPRTNSATAPRQIFTPEQEYLKSLMTRADQLLEDSTPRRPYWRERKAGPASPSAIRLSSSAVVREFVDLIDELSQKGYLEKNFGNDCPDEESYIDPNNVLWKKLGVETLWPLDRSALNSDLDMFFDVVEVLHDLIARPLTRSMHGYAGCTWHYGNFDVSSGRAVYIWRVNRIFDNSTLGLRLAENGDDSGRLVTTTDDGRAALTSAVSARKDDGPADQVRHALELFRDRSADRNSKRSAVAVLALVLEERRHGVIAESLSSGDRGALFNIANNFHIRHQDAKQRRDYDDFYLDWIFWVYLATIELTNRVLDGQNAAEGHQSQG